MILFPVFQISFFTLFFCYIGYGGLIFIINTVRKLLVSRPGVVQEMEDPDVTLIIAAYNEATILRQKIKNCLDIDYPANKLRIIFVTDGTTDDSEQLVTGESSVTLLHQSERRGKLAAIIRAMKQVNDPIVVFSDANTMLNRECIRKIVSHYTDPHIGGVAGEKKIIRNAESSAIGEAEGLYWKYESFMKQQDADFNTVAGAAGELFSIRTHLFQPPAADIILDDFVISMKVCLQGYKIAYEPAAYASELPSASLKEEAKRKTRISAGAFQAMGYLREALNFFKFPLLSFQYFSRRILRWVFCPWMLIVLLLSNLVIVVQPFAPLYYYWFFIGQLLFYLMAIIGWILIRSGKRIGIFAVPYYFLFMNFCMIAGFIRFLQKKQTVLWEKAERM